MEIEEMLGCGSGGPAFKENAVQDILNGSLNEEGSQNSNLIISTRLEPLAHLRNNTNISFLTDNLILTSAASVSSLVLDTLDITCVINVAPELPDTPKRRDVTYYKIEICDSPSSSILPHFDEAVDLIEHVATLGGRTLVYCVAGVSRSASICTAYLMKHHQLTLLESYNYVKSRRPKIKPNCGFFKQLIEYERKLYKSNTVKMVFNEFVQMEIPDVYDSEYRVVRSFNKKRRDRNH